ncbi:unnamed protein product [Cylindrotheca closterium]|uniref:Transmembrane 9 superfamily member n=1 Tax=Cylindrotheca closterium TaxID=2856 RepID=A0AAD2FLR1_9STRA|nr:unnamed protein product [Cylindrotheca closterium]
MLVVLLPLLSTLGTSLPGESITRRRDSVVQLHFVKRPILPFNITFLQSRDYYDNDVDNVVEDSVGSFLQTEFEQAYRFFYALELDKLPSSAELEWPFVRVNVSFAGSFVFVLSGVIPEDSELHCLQQEVLLDSYVSEYENLVEFNETGAVELDYIDFGNNVVSCTNVDDDDTPITDATADQETDDDKVDKSAEPATQRSDRQPEAKSINLKEFVLSREFMFAALATVLLPMLICLGCFWRQTTKVVRRRESKADKNERDRSSTGKTSVIIPS